MRKISSSFTLRLTTRILLCTLLLFVATLFVVGLFVNRLLKKEAADRSYSALQTSTLYINNNLQQVETAIENNVWLVEQYKNDTSLLYYITSKIIKDNPGVIGSIVALNPEKYNGIKYAGYSKRINNSNHIFSKNISSRDYDYLTMDWYQIPILMGTASWSEPYYDDGGADKLVTTYSYPLKDKNGEVYAILTADLSLQWLTSKATSIKPYEESRNMIISRNGSFIVNSLYGSSSSETIFSYAFQYGNDSTLIKAGKRMLKGISDDFEINVDGNQSYGVYGPLDNGWSIMILSNYNDVFEPNIVINIILISISILSIILISIICIKLISRLTKPIHQFSEVILKIADDNLDNVLPTIKSKDEIRVLRDAIEKMQNSIKENNDHRKDIQGARNIQTSVVPANSFRYEGVDLYAMIEPAKEVGGDLFDYHLSLNKNKLFFVVGDVSGKGLPAALFMSMVFSAFRLISRIEMDEKSIVKHVNNSLSADNRYDMFVTVFFATLDMDTLNLRFCNAGHNPPVIIWPDENSATFLKTNPNLVIGAFEGFNYEDQEIQLKKGTRLIVYSDGVTEAERADKEQYGEQRLLKWASSLPAEISSEDAAMSLREDVRMFTQSGDTFNPQNDDITIMIITI